MRKLGPLQIGLVAFGYSAFSALAIQWVLLPYVFPSWHAGHGLMIGHDWVNYHRIAAELALQIRNEGWRVWSLEPHGFGWIEPGVAAAIYAVTVSEPWVLIPLNAFIHAFSFVLIFLIFNAVYPGKEKFAALASLPFLLLPSSQLWVAQIHKDGAAILGVLLFLWGEVSLFDKTRLTRQRLFFPVLAVFSGLVLTNRVRPYWGTILGGLLQGFFLVWIVSQLVMVLRSREYSKTLGRVGFVWVGFWFTFAILGSNHGFLFPGTKRISALSLSPPSLAPTSGTVATEKSVPAEEPVRVGDAAEWQYSSWLPRSLDNQLSSMALARIGFLVDPRSRSNIDSEVRLKTAMDFVWYFPRATQVSLFAPFPTQWFANAASAVSGSLRLMVGMEMVVLYLLFPFAIFFLVCHRRNLQLWVVLLVCLIFPFLFAYAIPNLGAFHRFRYLFHTLWCGLGILGVSLFYEKRTSSELDSQSRQA